MTAEELIAKWRERAEQANALVEEYSHGGDYAGNGFAFLKERRIWTTCADELDALLRAAAPRAQEFVDDQSRCAICGWALVAEAERGCVPGNCSQRPFPQWFYAPERAAREYKQDLTRFDRRAILPVSTGETPPQAQEPK